jgi:hypothetical protein
VGSHGIEVDISTDGPIIGLILDQLGLVPTLEEMSGSLMPGGDALGVGRAEPLHARRQVGYRGANQQMEMIGHQNEADDLPPGPGRLSGEQFQELLSIVVIVHDVLSDVAPRHDVIDGARELDTQSSWHRTKPPGRVDKSGLFLLPPRIMIRQTGQDLKGLLEKDGGFIIMLLIPTIFLYNYTYDPNHFQTIFL